MGDLENQLALLKDKQFVLEVMFTNLLNSESKKEIWLPKELWRTDLALSKEAILDSIQSNNHQLLSLSFQQEALSFKKEVAKKACCTKAAKKECKTKCTKNASIKACKADCTKACCKKEAKN